MARGLIKTLGLAGAALTAWYFLDPKKGADRRESFKKSAKDLYDTAGDEIGRLGKDLSSGVSDTLGMVGERVGDITTKVGEMTSKVSEMTGMSRTADAAPAHNGAPAKKLGAKTSA